jgi:hypothetical protein
MTSDWSVLPRDSDQVHSDPVNYPIKSTLTPLSGFVAAGDGNRKAAGRDRRGEHIAGGARRETPARTGSYP